MLRLEEQNNWGYVTGSMVGTRVSNTWGTSITPANNAQNGTFTLVLAAASITQDCYWMEIDIFAGATSTAARDILVTIGIDDAGGTSYVAMINNLLGSGAAPALNLGGGIHYAFPVFVKSGSQIAARASVNNGTVGTVRVAVTLKGAPSRPDLIWYGSNVESIGVTTASSSGTAVTSGTSSEGTYTSLGTLASACGYITCGFGVNDATMNALSYTMDLAYGTTQQTIIDGTLISTDGTEQVSYFAKGTYCDLGAGETIYGRLQCSGTADAALSMAAYAVNY